MLLRVARGAVAAVAPLAIALGAHAPVGFEIGIVMLRVVAHDPAVDAAGVAFHFCKPL